MLRTVTATDIEEALAAKGFKPASSTSTTPGFKIQLIEGAFFIYHRPVSEDIDAVLLTLDEYAQALTEKHIPASVDTDNVRVKVDTMLDADPSATEQHKNDVVKVQAAVAKRVATTRAAATTASSTIPPRDKVAPEDLPGVHEIIMITHSDDHGKHGKVLELTPQYLKIEVLAGKHRTAQLRYTSYRRLTAEEQAAYDAQVTASVAPIVDAEVPEDVEA